MIPDFEISNLLFLQQNVIENVAFDPDPAKTTLLLFIRSKHILFGEENETKKLKL